MKTCYGAFAKVSDYVTLTKPRIVLLLLVTALAAMFLAAQSVPPLSLMILVLGAGALAAGGANALNHYLDRDIDQQMHRTRHRPVPSKRIGPHSALIFGILLNLLALLIFSLWVNPLSGVIAVGATLFYVLVYTVWLKRSTPQNIVIGGAAGAVPPLVGWAAVTGGVSLPALYLFAIIFFWTPPHFWALALLLRDDYARAGVPMLPVVTSPEETSRQIFLYTLLLTAVTILFHLTGRTGWIYLTSALLLGALFLALAGYLLRSNSARGARAVFYYSMVYLSAIFAALVVDTLVP
ncbi:MAG: protoheme IX farnesyltransferase [Chloroflexi bacterium]|nr:protoheme IX farnesyltransferase [Chloroflexota bacterium]